MSDTLTQYNRHGCRLGNTSDDDDDDDDDGDDGDEVFLFLILF